MMKAVFKLLPVIIFSFMVLATTAQPFNEKNTAIHNKPYKVLTSGKQLTIKSNKPIRHIMLWTTGGNRIVEQKEINNQQCVVQIPVNQKTFFIMVAMGDGKVYTEKIGIQ
jgi:hypothetical protein